MDIFQRLKDDHRQVEAVFAELAKAAGPTERMALTERLQQLLIPHVRGEEQLVYPHLDSLPQGHQRHIQSVEEHHTVELLLQEMLLISANDERFTAKCTVLRELVRHHVAEEENEIFPQLQAHLGKGQAQAVAEAMAAFKQQSPVKGGRLAA